MIAVHLNKVQSIQAHYISELTNQHANALSALELLWRKTTDRQDRIYVYQICRLFRYNNTIITATPDELERLEKKIGSVPKIKYLVKGKKVKSHYRTKNSEIWKKIVAALGYEGLRSKFYPRYFGLLGIKSCVYCNSQYTLSVEKSAGVYIAKYDVDHHQSKSSYPWQCISLFNLYPSCVPCNRVKSSRSIAFKLYSDDVSLVSKSGFRFQLSALSKAQYLTTKDINDIKITFEDLSGKTDYDTMFSISGIYDTQLDLAEQLIISSQMYDKASRVSLSENFKKLKITPDVFNRVILGTYTAEKDIHRRPMSKFTQDIARDLGLLK